MFYHSSHFTEEKTESWGVTRHTQGHIDIAEPKSLTFFFPVLESSRGDMLGPSG